MDIIDLSQDDYEFTPFSFDSNELLHDATGTRDLPHPARATRQTTIGEYATATPRNSPILLQGTDATTYSRRGVESTQTGHHGTEESTSATLQFSSDDRSVVSGITSDGTPSVFTPSIDTTKNSNREATHWLITCSDCTKVKPRLDLTLFNRGPGFPKSNGVKAMAGQYETCPTTNTLHWHLYVHFTRSIRWKTLKNYLVNVTQAAGVSVKPVKVGTQYTVYKYCTKAKTRNLDYAHLNFVMNPPSNKHKLRSKQPSAEAITAPKKTKKATKEELLWEFLKDKLHMGWWEIYHHADTPDDMKYQLVHSTMEKKWDDMRAAHFGTRVIETVTILYGAAGVGKTTTAKQMFPGLKTYVKDTTTQQWWDGLSIADEVLIIEEMDGQQINIRTFLQLTDIGKQAPQLQVKGSVIKANYKHVIITSNRHPMTWYETTFLREPFRWNAFARRITKCVFYPRHKDDGNINVYGNGEVQADEEDLSEMEANMTWMGIAKQKTNMQASNDPVFNNYVNMMI